MTTLTHIHVEAQRLAERPGRAPLFGGLLWRASRRTNSWAAGMAGRRWLPVFALLVHRGRRTGRTYRTPVAARRAGDGFVVCLAFGAQVDWHRNLIAAGGGVIRWRDHDYPIAGPERIGAAEGLAQFNPLQRVFLRLGRIDGFIRLRDAAPSAS